MGLLALGLLNIGVKAFSTVRQINAQKSANRAANESRNVSGANEQFRNKIARRQAAKEARFRRARILQTSANQGVGASSGALGAFSAVGSNFGSAISGQSTQGLATAGVNQALENQASAVSKGNRAAAFGNFFESAMGLYNSFQDYQDVG